MDIVGWITRVNLADWAILAFLAVMFILGYAQGAIRRVLGIASLVFSFLLAGQLRTPLGSFLADNWTQWPPEYNHMLAFGTLFVVLGVAFAIAIQSFYRRSAILAKHPIVDELIGGLLGLVEGLFVIGFAIIILDSFYGLKLPIADGQLSFVKDIHGAIDPTGTARVFRQDLIPGFLAIVAPLVPPDVRAVFGVH